MVTTQPYTTLYVTIETIMGSSHCEIKNERTYKKNANKINFAAIFASCGVLKQ